MRNLCLASAALLMLAGCGRNETVAMEGGANNPQTGQRTWIKIVVRVKAQRVGNC